ncbi:hypothetical protein PIB30_063262 [Stylosanthes scabra]|uniref:Uncharacterized protein n=1 Tax=Stylosanthes scabra TaxID=79078 RepID=A0ABU6RMJ5_9FABA|nr:hypothetical protein [Stylosanthes scabra]
MDRLNFMSNRNLDSSLMDQKIRPWSCDEQMAHGSCRMKAPDSFEDCAREVINEAGSGFTIGVLGGFIFHSIKGICTSPHGGRMSGAYEAVRLKVPHVACKYASWLALFTAFDYSLQHARQVDNPSNRFASGAAATGLLSFRRGLRIFAQPLQEMPRIPADLPADFFTFLADFNVTGGFTGGIFSAGNLLPADFLNPPVITGGFFRRYKVLGDEIGATITGGITGGFFPP